MNDEDNTPRCSLCGCTVHEAAERGSYLQRVSPFGEDFIGECRPSCEQITGDQDDAVMRALRDAKPKKEVCEHGEGLTDYCEPCGRIHGSEG